MKAGLVRCAGLLAALVLFTVGPARAQPAPTEEAGADLTIYVLTFGPGDHPFFKFGHNAIWVQPRDGRGLVFNFGTFSFDNPNLIPMFLRGRLTYWLSVSPAVETLYSYQASNRTIEAQELDLTPAERLALFQNLSDNARPEKREYLYDYFWDNCSTRVRDAVDVVVHGRVALAGKAPAAMNLRAHALRMVADLEWEYLGLHFGLGSLTDVPLDRWRESFLPEKLRDLLGAVTVDRGGVVRPLVKSEKLIFQAQRPPILQRPPSWTAWFALTGLALGAVLGVLGRLAVRRRWARVTLGAGASFFGLILGLLGVILILLWAFTNHRAAHANANILLCAPWALALMPLGVGVALGRAWSIRGATYVAAATALLAVAAVLAKVLPGTAQDNAAFISLLLPLWLGLTYGLRQLMLAAKSP
jgi:hypothetical protein